jgi:hypothetical protein
MNRIQRCLSALAALAGVLVAGIAAAPAALASLPPPDPNPADYVPPPVVHTVVTGGMPGGQIVLLVVGAAVLAGVVAVRTDRAWAARRPVATSPAPATDHPAPQDLRFQRRS